MEMLFRLRSEKIEPPHSIIFATQPSSVSLVKQVEEAKADEMWSFVQCKKQERWLWHAIDPQTGQVLASVLADHKDQA
jgi:insertion element IS1 protein InsB